MAAAKFPRLHQELRDKPIVVPDKRSKVPLAVRQLGLFRILETILGAPRGARQADALPALVGEAAAEERQIALRVATKEAYGAYLTTALRRLKASTAPTIGAPPPAGSAGEGSVGAAEAARAGAKRSRQEAPDEFAAPAAEATVAAAPLRPAWRLAQPLGVRKQAAPTCPVCGEPAEAGIGAAVAVCAGDTWHQACIDATAYL